MPSHQSSTPEQQAFEENFKKNYAFATLAFPNERWIDASTIKLGAEAEFEIPKNADKIKVAQSRLTPSKNRNSISDNDAKTLAKELRQASVLVDKGASIFILPKRRGADGRFLPGPDALVNGILYEFKTITGSLRRVETRFRESRGQGQNVYIRVMNPDITKNDVIQKMYNIVNGVNYTGGFKGNLIFSIREKNLDHVYYVKISDFKK